MMRKKQLIASAAVALATLAAYLPTLGNGFVEWDDGLYVYENVPIRSFGLKFIAWAFTPFSDGNWFPLTLISHALDYALWGLNPAGHHLTSILLHAVNTFLVVFLAVKLLEMPGVFRLSAAMPDGAQDFPREQGVLGAAVLTGVLFGLHPLHVESVAWVSERKDLLCGLFFLLSILSYLRHANATQRYDAAWSYRRVWGKYYGASLFLFCLALMSKPMAVSLPIVLLILDWYPLGRARSRTALLHACLEKAPFLAGSLLVSAVTFFSQKSAGSMEFMDQLPLWTRGVVAIKAVALYLWKMVYPADLLPYYSYARDISLLSTGTVVSCSVVVLITAASVALAGRQRWLPAAWGYYLATLLPVIGLVQVGGQAMADRYTYLPSIAPFLVAGAFFCRIAFSALSAAGITRFASRGLPAALLIAGILFSVLTVRQIAVWKDGISLWDHVIQKSTERAPLAYLSRGYAHLAKGNYAKARADFSSALELNTEYLKAFYALGKTYHMLDDFDAAIQYYSRAIALKPAFKEAYVARAEAYTLSGRTDSAFVDYEAALALDPRYADAYVGRALLFKSQGRMVSAVRDLTAAIDANPFHAGAFYYRGAVFRGLGQFGRALDELTRSLELDPANETAYVERGMVLKEMGLPDRALEDYTRSISIKASSEAFNNRGNIYKNNGELDLAVADYGSAILLNPDFHLAYCNRGIAYGSMGRVDDALKDLSIALALQPDMVKAYLERGRLFAKSGRRGLAVQDFRKACERGSEEGCAALSRRERR